MAGSMIELRRHMKAFPGRLLLASSGLMLGLSAAATHPVAASPKSKPAPVELKTATTAAFDQYVRLTEARNEIELKRGDQLLWIDGLPETERSAAYAELKRGEVKMQKLETLENGTPIYCPGGMIPHWVGAVFIPGVRVSDVLAVLEDYDHHAE